MSWTTTTDYSEYNCFTVSDTNLWTYLKTVDLYRQDSQMMRGIWSYTSLKHAKGINKKDASIECYKDGNSAPDEHLVGLVYR